MKKIQDLLRSSIGLHAATIGAPVVEHTIRSRMARIGLSCHDAYLELLRRSPSEWNNLVETLVVTETWFFREKKPFATLVRLVTDEWLGAHPDETLRLLSIPCASGEEPYSMAMALLDAGVPAARFQIDAVDISARALFFAQRGIFGRNSFRGGDLEFRNRHFAPTRGGYLLNPAVRRAVRFQRGNILAHDCLGDGRVYDFIFCRNLLIYFDKPTQSETLAKLNRLLAANGVLFTGAAELPLAVEYGFANLNAAGAFACRKPVAQANASAAENRRLVRDRSVPGTTISASSRPAAPRVTITVPLQPASELARARELATTGQFDEAASLCHSHLRDRGVCAEAFYILGLVRDASGADTEAGEFYRKAVYLEPNHLDALQRWALVSERNGRHDQARRLRARVERRLPDQVSSSL